LNVILSRAREHLAVISSIRHHDITNEHNHGANTLKKYLQFAEATSCGNDAQARRVLENVNPLARKAIAPASSGDAVVAALAAALSAKGCAVDQGVGQSRLRCDLAVRARSESHYLLGTLVDTTAHYLEPSAGSLSGTAPDASRVRMALRAGARQGLVSGPWRSAGSPPARSR
jgi:hypothetical protein